MLQAALAANKRRCIRPLPWESGPVGLVFGGTRTTSGTASSIAQWLRQDGGGEVEIAGVETVAPRGRRARGFDRDAGLPPEEEDSQERRKAVRLWCGVVRDIGQHCELFRSCGSLEEVDAGVEDALAAKATATLRARGYAIGAFVAWARKWGVEPWPLAEKTAYRYMRHLASMRAPATKATSAIKAFAFVGFVFGVDGAGHFKSPRVNGAAWTMFVRKRLTAGRSPLRVDQVRLLQATVSAESAENLDRLMSGLVCCLVACRLRYFDAQRASEEPVLDVLESGYGYIEVHLNETKSTNTPRTKRVKKVGVGHALGLDGGLWAREWLELRRRVGISASKFKCLQPAPDGQGGWLRRRLRSHELLGWLRRFLEVSTARPGKEQSLGTHSSKVTLLSWAGKFGIHKGDARTLGYHVKSKDTQVNLYSRDAQAAPMRRLWKVLLAISNGKFMPDATRSGHFGGEEQCDKKSEGLYILSKLYG